MKISHIRKRLREHNLEFLEATISTAYECLSCDFIFLNKVGERFSSNVCYTEEPDQELEQEILNNGLFENQVANGIIDSIFYSKPGVCINGPLAGNTYDQVDLESINIPVVGDISRKLIDGINSKFCGYSYRRIETSIGFSWQYLDQETPDWDSRSRCHDWKNYVTDDLKAIWKSFSPEQKRVVADALQQAADKEEWD